MANPTVSVVIPAYNSARMIEQTLASVCAQDFADFEVIVVNDGSPDQTSQIVRSVVDPRIRLIEKANAGLPAARNSGVAAARGDYIAFLDHDDFWHPQKLSAQLECFRLHPTAGVVYGEFRSWDGIAAPAFDDAPLDGNNIVPALSGWIYHKLLLTNWVMITTALYKREVIERIGPFDTSLPRADDWDYAIRTSRHYEFRKLRQVVALSRSHPQRMSRQSYPINPAEELRAHAIAQYGYVGPDGSRVDRGALRDRIARDRLSFGLMQYGAGNWRAAALAFGSCLRAKPIHLKATAYLVASALRWIAKPRRHHPRPD